MDYLDPKFLRNLERLRMLSRKTFSGNMRGERKSRKKGASVEFADFTKYNMGDDFRYIDWNAYARLETLILKLFMEEEDLLIYILLDSSASMNYGHPNKHEFAKKIVAALSYIGTANLDRVKILSFSDHLEEKLPMIRSKSKIYQILDFLKELPASGTATHLEQMVDQFLIRHKKPGLCILISDFLDPSGYETSLKKLSYYLFEPAVIQVFSPEEIQPQYLGDLELRDIETGEKLDLSMNRSAIQHYQATLKAFCEGLEKFCQTMNILFLRTISATPFEEVVLQYLRRSHFIN
ncbi:MAG: DUF58 domain-containing protein [Planctomycetota bacterium]